MARSKASGALPALFNAGWSRVPGGRGASGSGGRAGASLRRSSQMVRAAGGYSPAVFKAIRNGGCHSGAQLARQLTYLTTKSSLIFDAFGRHDGKERLTRDEIAAMSKRFSDTWSNKHQSKLGNTSHLLMSFPVGTSPKAVAGVARRVCEQFFHGAEGRPAFDYIVAVHTDRAHPHAHVVLNRRSPDGATFYLRSGHQFSYELFREAMAVHGDAYGLRLEASRRLDRGVLTLDARSLAVRQARAVGQEDLERPREGASLKRALQVVALASLTYAGLAQVARADGFEAVSEALQRASLVLAQNGVILPTKEFVMADTQGSFDGLVREFASNVEALEARMASAPDAQRPRLEQGLTSALAGIAVLNPIGEHSAALREPPSDYGLYSQVRSTAERHDQLEDPAVRGRVDAALAGTGLSTTEVLARVALRADSAALEDHWQARDKATVAASLGLDLDREADEHRVLDRLEGVYATVADTLEAAGVLRDVASYDAVSNHLEAEEAELDQRRARVQADPTSEPIPARRIDPADDPATGPDHQDERARAQAEAADEALVMAVVARVRDAEPRAPAFRDAGEAQAFREVLDRWLGEQGRAQIAQGEHAALGPTVPSRIDRIALTKAYLESDPATQGSATHTQALKDLAGAQIDALRERNGHSERGARHV